MKTRTRLTTPVYIAQEKGHAELLNLLLEKGAPENPGFLWQFRRSVIIRWSNLLCRWRCIWFENWSVLTISVYSAPEKGHLELSSLLLERGAPQNPDFLWQFRRLIIKRWSHLLCRWKCPWFGHLKLFSLVSRTPQRKATVAVQDSMVQLKFLKSANNGWKVL